MTPLKPQPATRTWGTRFDFLPSSPPPSPSAESLSETLSDPLNNKEERMSHDASIFVGSLPTNIDHAELSRLLTEHLAEHAQVKSIKVVRDAKGGVCAFVQCEDTNAAANLINILHSTPPKTFYGRTLRYEFARAFRTLLISYRTPTQRLDRSGLNTAAQGLEHLELDLPVAMRIWRPRQGKTALITYNAEAVEADSLFKNKQGALPFGDLEPAIYLNPLPFDDKTLKTLATYFGPLEYFRPYNQDENAGIEKFPFPHNGSRKPTMDQGCFEVKWAHRDDCISALMTLRRVPHLTVTWASHSHQGHQFPVPPRRPGKPFMDPRRAWTKGAYRPTVPRPSPQNEEFATSEPSPPEYDMGENWGIMLHSQPPLMNLSPPTSQNSTLVGGISTAEWRDTDFPPLGETQSEFKAEVCGVWGEKKHTTVNSEREELDGPMIDSLRLEQDGISTCGTVMTTNVISQMDLKDVPQELTMPPTPELGMSPITPITPGAVFPPTPTASDGVQITKPKDPLFGDQDVLSNTPVCENFPVIDPTSLFVGGLDLCWNEVHVANIFQKFGGLVSVKLVKPTTARAAFAFIQFDNTESPAQAVTEEHNKIYNGRAIRVQLRDCNPTRRFRSRYQPQMQPQFRSAIDGLVDQKLGVREAVPDVPFSIVQPLDTKESVSTLNASENGGISQANEVVASENQSLNMPTDQPSSTSDEGAASCPENYREWYEADQEQVPQSKSPIPSPDANGTFLYPQPTGSYYNASNSWMPPYGAHPSYQMTFYGYAAYPTPTGYAAVDPNTVPRYPTPWQFGAYVPYPNPTPCPAATGVDNPSGVPSTTQPPLVPTGFLQHPDQGLIPVYPTDAIDQYMSTQQPSIAPQGQLGQPLPWMQQHPPPAYTQGLPRLNVPSGRPIQPSPLQTPNPSFGQGSQSCSTFPSAVSFQTVPPSTSLQIPVPSFPGRPAETSALNAPPFRRQQGRRDHHFTSGNRNYAARQSAHRPPNVRRHTNASGQQNDPHQVRNAHFMPSSSLPPAEWNQWHATH